MDAVCKGTTVRKISRDQVGWQVLISVSLTGKRPKPYSQPVGGLFSPLARIPPQREQSSSILLARVSGVLIAPDSVFPGR